MIWTALFVVGLALTDLLRGSRLAPPVPALIGGAAVMIIGLASGISGLEVLLLFPITAAVVAWGLLVRAGRARPALTVGLTALALLLLVPLPEVADFGALGRWIADDPALFAGWAPDRALLLGAVGLAMISTGNTLVRLVLEATHTLMPAQMQASRLKGGRLLGPMERLFILGLGLTGNLTAAGLVIAAKGLIRWPELQSHRDAGRILGEPDIDEITEYFLVGSFLSWLVALGGLVLLGGELSPGR